MAVIKPTPRITCQTAQPERLDHSLFGLLYRQSGVSAVVPVKVGTGEGDAPVPMSHG